MKTSKEMRQGKKIFLNQLQYLQDGGCESVPGTMTGGATSVRTDAKRFGVPKKLLGAFASYREEYLLDDASGCISENGPFYDDGTLRGIMDKLRYFHWPIVDLLDHEFPDFYFYVNIEPDYAGSSTILVTAEAKERKRGETFPGIVAYSNFRKVWVPVSENNPEGLYDVLEYLLSIMRKNMSCFKCFLTSMEGEKPCTPEIATKEGK
jgi:hypothetical protein